MDTILHDIRVSIRALLNRPGFTAVAVATLALGLGATTALFSVVYGVLLRPLPYPESGRIVSIWQTARNNPGPNPDGSVSHMNFVDWKQAAGSLEAAALYSSATYVVSDVNDAEVVQGGVVSPEFFKVFGANLVKGRAFLSDEDVVNGPRVAIVGYGFWQERLGGRADVIGSSIELSSRRYEIVGVAPAGFGFPRDARIWTPIQIDDAACGRGCVFLNALARLKPGVTPASARLEMQGIAARLEKAYPAVNTNTTTGLVTLQDEIVGDVRPALLMLLGAVAMVLLIACANVANLLLVRGAARQGEIAIRAALGAGRVRLLRFLLAESFVLALVGAGVGLLTAWWGVDALKRLAPATIPRLADVRFDALTFLFAMGTATITALLFGLGPAVQVAGVPLGSLLGARGETAGRRTRWTRTGLLVAEVALSFMLLVGAGLLVRSMVRLQDIDPGFKANGLTIFTLALPGARYPQTADAVRGFDQIAERLSAEPGVQSVARISGLPLGTSENVFNFSRLDRPAPTPGTAPIALYRVVDAPYFQTMGIPIVSGRAFTPDDRDGNPPVLIISRLMADRFWPGEDPVGHRVSVSTNASQAKTIVGVAADVRSSSLSELPQPEMYVPHAQAGARAMTFVVRSALPAGEVLSASREAVHRFDAKLPLIRPGSESALVAREMARPQFYLVLLALFAGVAVALAAVGIYGVVAYTVAQRTREIGVRLALGAEPSEVVRLIMWDGLRPAALGLVIGAGGAIAAGRVIARFLYQVQPRDPLTMALVVATVIGVVLVACFIPSRRAARIPPAVALRME
ncbi:MAG TPA: ABC transporter permease [Vicinamibacterales bacterium]